MDTARFTAPSQVRDAGRFPADSDPPAMARAKPQQQVAASLERVARVLAAFSHSDRQVDEVFCALLEAGCADLPLPGSGSTLARWQMLAAVAAFDLSVVKLFEGHTDAVAIMRELGESDLPADSSWATWAAEAPGARVRLTSHKDGSVRLSGTKAWCSGARTVSHALLTVWDEQDRPRLAAVAMRQPGVVINDDGWHAVGMADTRSANVTFDNVPAKTIGASGDYLDRPGFWQGGAGIAACWYGGATRLADAVARRARTSDGAHLLAHLGAIDVALVQAGALLRETASWMDANATADARIPALRVRAAVEGAATLTLYHTGRALGAGPFCKDAAFARMSADLPVFLRQSHAEQDLVELSREKDQGETPWSL